MMHDTTLRLTLTISFFVFFSFVAIAQKKFHLIINLPKGIHKSKMEVWLDNGKSDRKMNSDSTLGNQLILTGEYFAQYAVITLFYPPDELFKNGNTNKFFVEGKNAIVTFYQSKTTDSVFSSYTLENVLDFKAESKRMRDYCAFERRQALEYEVKYEDEIFNGTDTAIQNNYFGVLMKNLGTKEIEYIKNNPDSYFSFYIFKGNVTGRGGILTPESMLEVFNIFPEKFRYSDEGNYLHEFINARTSLKSNKTPIDFKSKDINGKEIEVSKFKGEKYVMIHFWATWCSPCIEELPVIKQIYDLYKSKGLEIISVSVASNYKHYTQTVDKYHMVWTQIYNDFDLYSKFGRSPTPRIYLIDKNWNVVYDTIGSGKVAEANLSDLHLILEKAFN